MMRYEQDSTSNDEESHLSASPMESVVLDDPPNGVSNRQTSAAAEGGEPLVNSQPEPAQCHPLSPPPEIATAADESPRFTRQQPNPSSSSINSFLDPPSYADAMFRSFDGEASEIDGYDQSGSSDSEYLHVSVSDPQKVTETSNSLVPGGNWYYTYLITTTTNMPEFEEPEFSVRRRFSEVVTLSDRLTESYRGYFIPLRPDKSIVESQMMQNNEFVEQRRVAIEKYMKKLAAHPVIRKSDELRVFLQVQGKLPLAKTTDVASRVLDSAVKLPKQLMGDPVTAVVEPHEVVQPARGGMDLLRLFKELKQAVANDWGGAKPPVAEEDKEFLEKKEKLRELEEQLSNVSQQAESLVKAQQDIGETMGELGLAFVKLTKFEIEEAVYEIQRVRAAEMKNVATAAVKASRLYRELNAQTVKHLVIIRSVDVDCPCLFNYDVSTSYVRRDIR